MSFRPACTLILMAALLGTATTALAAQTDTDRQASVVLEARNKSPDEVKSILARLSTRQKDDLVRQQAIIDDAAKRLPPPAMPARLPTAPRRSPASFRTMTSTTS